MPTHPESEPQSAVRLYNINSSTDKNSNINDYKISSSSKDDVAVEKHWDPQPTVPSATSCMTMTTPTPDVSSKLPSLLVRMPNTAWGIGMGLAGESVMWRNVQTTSFFNDHITGVDDGGGGGGVILPNALFWWAAVVVAVIVGTTYTYKILWHFPLVRDEYSCPERIHFMNGPHLTLLLLAIGVPPAMNVSHRTLQCLFAIGLVAQTVITQFIYEMWMFSTSSSLFCHAKPQFLLSAVGWFMLAVLGQLANVERDWGLAIPAFCFGAGTMFYLTVVIVLFNGQKFVRNSPALFLLIAAPSLAVTALDLFDQDPNTFSLAAEMVLGWCIVVALLLVRVGPSIAMRPPVLGSYWAYVFPISGLASATIRYAGVTKSTASRVIALTFLGVATLTLVLVFGRTVVHSYVVYKGRGEWSDPLIAPNTLDIEDEQKHETSRVPSASDIDRDLTQLEDV